MVDEPPQVWVDDAIARRASIGLPGIGVLCCRWTASLCERLCFWITKPSSAAMI